MVQINRYDEIIKSLRHIQFIKNSHCVICQTRLGEPLIALPRFPLTEIYTPKLISEKLGFVDQFFHICSLCGHGQIQNIIAPEILYSTNYYFRTSISSSAMGALDHFVSFIHRVRGKKNFHTIIEIGCNDLYLLNSLKIKAKRFIGIDPIWKGKEQKRDNGKINVIGDLMENVHLDEGSGKVELVLSSHTLEHVKDPVLILKRLLKTANDQTLFVFQFPDLNLLIQNFRFDQIFHQHVNYFTLTSFLYLLDECGGELLDYDFNPYHWGTLLVVFRKKQSRQHKKSIRSVQSRGNFTPQQIVDRYRIFKNNLRLTNERLNAYKNGKIYGYGAALMLPVLSYHLNNDLSCLECVLDDDPRKDGWYYVNLPVKIRDTRKVRNLKQATILVTSVSAVMNVRKILSKLIVIDPQHIISPLNIF